MVALRAFANRSDLVDGLSDEIVRRLSAAVAARGRASLVVPGGRSPAILFDGLCGRFAPWRNVTIALSDELWCAPDAVSRHEDLVRARLCKGRAGAARFVPFPKSASSPASAAERAEWVLGDVARASDVSVLGATAKGQVASLSASGVEVGGGRLVRAVHCTQFHDAPHRLTLTHAALAGSRFVALAISGRQKFAALQRALQGEPSPLRQLLGESRGPLEVFWCP